MGIKAEGSKTPWDTDQAAQPDHIRDLGENIIEIKLVKGQMRKGVMRSEKRPKDLYSPEEALQLKMSFKFKLLTPLNFDGDIVIAQLPWDGNSPDNSIRINAKNQEVYYLNYNQNGNPKRKPFDLFTARLGEEFEVVYLLKGESNNTGRVEVYINGKKMVYFNGQNLFPPLDSKRYPKLGLYLDKDLPEGTPEVVVQLRDIKFGTTDATFEELSSANPQNPNQPGDQETNSPNTETNNPNEETENQETENTNIKPKLEDLEAELSRMAESISSMRGTIRDIYQEN